MTCISISFKRKKGEITRAYVNTITHASAFIINLAASCDSSYKTSRYMRYSCVAGVLEKIDIYLRFMNNQWFIMCKDDDDAKWVPVSFILAEEGGAKCAEH